MRPETQDAYDLLHEGSLALAKMEANGFRIDEQQLDKELRKTTKEIKQVEEEFYETDLYKRWRKEYKGRTKITSRDQLAHVLFDVMKYPIRERTEKGKPKVDELNLIGLDEGAAKWIRIEKLKKVKGTFLSGIKREVVNGYLHAIFNLHINITFRSSSDSINFQNFPIRSEEFAKRIRSVFIARKGRRIIEVDYGGIEVKVAACYNKDPVLISYIKDPTKDMHRDMAAECYLCKPEEVTKTMRYNAKNKFVFPEFYGSFYAQCAPALWDAIRSMNGMEVNGVPLYDHLRSKGIKKLGACEFDKQPRPGTFEHHIQQVEKDFWGRRFKKYAKWKKSWYEEYLNTARCQMLTGFVVQGVYKKNEIINSPIQGSAFHCLLWSIIELQKQIEKRKMRTKLVGQIHDSIVADVPDCEVDDYLDLVQDVMTKKIRKHWDWIIVPLEIEAEMSPVNGNWFQKEKVELHGQAI